MKAPAQHRSPRMPWRGRLLREVMEQQGISQLQLAVAMGSGHAHVSKVLRGIRRPAQQAWWDACADALSIPREHVASEEAAALAWFVVVARLPNDEAGHSLADLIMDGIVRRELQEAEVS